MANSKPGRLPADVRPFHYNLTLEPDLERFNFRGGVEIGIHVLKITNSVTLHAGNLVIHNARISGFEIPEKNLIRGKGKDTLTLQLQNSLRAGETVMLSFSFAGVLNTDMAGFYRSVFKDKDGQAHHLAVTQMEPTDARHVFPCFDEPALKATFAITLITASHLQFKQGKKETAFNTTPPMSTYVVAVVVGELVVLQTDIYRVPIRLFAAAGTEIDRLGKFSLELTARTLAFYDEHFGTPFPLPKMDIVAVPDFIGAMENWGLVFYRERDLLFEISETSVSTLQRNVKLVQHELAHQWFGNLVTMEFWNDLWLNEGFATWMAWFACDAFYPEWGIWQIYTAESLQHGLQLDGMRSSHPIQVPIHGDDEIGQIFDDISYSKGACVLQMIAGALGQDVFLQGVRAYIRKYKYENAKTDDLWSALTETSGQDVGRLMHTWTKEVGFPLLLVTEDAINNTIHIRQTRFMMTADLLPSEDESIYSLSLGLRSAAGVNMDAMLTTREGTFTLASLDFFKINANHTGFYRTAYSPERLKKLGEAAVQGFLTVEDRVGLVADAAALTATGRLALIGDKEAQKAAFEMFAQFRAGDRSAIHPDLRAAVFGSVLKFGSTEEYNAVLDIYRTTEDSNERITALAALGHARSPALVQRTTAMLLGDQVRLQDIQAPMTNLGTHPNGIAALWHWITENWSIIKRRLSSGLLILSTVISLCTKGLTTEEQRRNVEEFFEKSKTKGFNNALRNSLDEIQIKIRWIERDAEDVQKWLDNYLETHGS
ncbi:uncharacterized protein N7498_000786 [Penicillium cinerascens]|uniref:Aminopeptidase n=1 Tax=Penicillium cinerascens TaxID=70096 RepID=A0A9W9TDE3_9EURO|nr:uncharacterized protein N7498_000786 [Penicillium cinerascens]KAJ5218687.1 hypothetical protein N7498_000786 [Penicillium cinerascens]